jgi:signal transduction histidine kinase
MTWRPTIRVRLAGAATLTAVVALLLLSSVANVLVDNALVGDVDSRITARTSMVVAELSESASTEIPGETTDPEYREPLLVWHFSDSGAPMAVGDLGPSAGLNLPASVRRTPGTRTVRIAGTRFRVKTTILPDGGTATVGATLASVDHATAALRLVGGLLGVPLALLVFVGAYVLARAALRPVESLRLTAEQVGEGSSSARFSTAAPFDEVGRLAATFDHMVDRLDRVRRRQDQISADASHELRTPLAAIEAEASLVLRHDRKGAEYRDSLRLIVDESRRMRAVLDGLLWLARADQGVSAPSAISQDLAEVARLAVRRFEPIVLGGGLMLRASIPSTPAPVRAPEHWLDRLLDALLDNACKYTPRGGTVELIISVETSAVVLQVADDGPGIRAEERNRLLRRFERGDQDSSGTGLGLAIAETVARATGAELFIGEVESGGALLGVRWPLVD